MFRKISIGVVLMIAWAGLAVAQPPDAWQRRGPGPGPAGRGGPGRGPALNPLSPAARLMLASPEERERVLRAFPPERQVQIRSQLEWFDNLPQEAKQAQIRRLERFTKLPPGERSLLRRQMQALRQLPPPRRQAIRRAVVTLQELPEAQRTARMRAPGFRARFSHEEWDIIAALSDVWPALLEDR